MNLDQTLHLHALPTTYMAFPLHIRFRYSVSPHFSSLHTHSSRAEPENKKFWAIAMFILFCFQFCVFFSISFVFLCSNPKISAQSTNQMPFRILIKIKSEETIESPLLRLRNRLEHFERFVWTGARGGGFRLHGDGFKFLRGKSSLPS